eukprot:1159957-Pelagomonas_calceolata.AAC.19
MIARVISQCKLLVRALAASEDMGVPCPVFSLVVSSPQALACALSPPYSVAFGTSVRDSLLPVRGLLGSACALSK